MEALFPLLLIAAILDAAVESFKLIKEQKAQWEHYAIFLLGLLIFMATQTNLFLLFGLGVANEGSNLYWYVSYLTGAIIGIRLSGGFHDLFKAVQGLKDTLTPS